jgi:hypothetical protein
MPAEEADVRLPSERFDYSPIAGRRPWKLPRGARIAVWTIVNIEEWDIEKPMPRGVLSAPQGVTDRARRAELGVARLRMRVGFWRMLEALTKRKIRATTAINANVCRSYEPVARAMKDAGWEFMGHGVKQGALHLVPDQREAIRTAVRMLTEYTGTKPKGWLGPGLTETWETLDIWPRRESSTSRTGSTTTSPTRSRPPRARWCRCRTRSSSTTSP